MKFSKNSFFFRENTQQKCLIMISNRLQKHKMQMRTNYWSFKDTCRCHLIQNFVKRLKIVNFLRFLLSKLTSRIWSWTMSKTSLSIAVVWIYWTTYDWMRSFTIFIQKESENQSMRNDWKWKEVEWREKKWFHEYNVFSCHVKMLISISIHREIFDNDVDR